MDYRKRMEVIENDDGMTKRSRVEVEVVVVVV
jgi:hypothetical protein